MGHGLLHEAASFELDCSLRRHLHWLERFRVLRLVGATLPHLEDPEITELQSTSNAIATHHPLSAVSGHRPKPRYAATTEASEPIRPP